MILQNFVDFMPADNIFHDIQLKPPWYWDFVSIFITYYW
jgi:hypothetical protein